MEISLTGKIIALSIVAVGIALPTFLIMFHCCFFCFSSKRNRELVPSDSYVLYGPSFKIEEETKGNALSTTSDNEKLFESKTERNKKVQN